MLNFLQVLLRLLDSAHATCACVPAAPEASLVEDLPLDVGGHLSEDACRSFSKFVVFDEVGDLIFRRSRDITSVSRLCTLSFCDSADAACARLSAASQAAKVHDFSLDDCRYCSQRICCSLIQLVVEDEELNFLTDILLWWMHGGVPEYRRRNVSLSLGNPADAASARLPAVQEASLLHDVRLNHWMHISQCFRRPLTELVFFNELVHFLRQRQRSRLRGVACWCVVLLIVPLLLWLCVASTTLFTSCFFNAPHAACARLTAALETSLLEHSLLNVAVRSSQGFGSPFAEALVFNEAFDVIRGGRWRILCSSRGRL
mmetsp:Transcript_47195/g.84985  ORF Transcript_47195/g.84985 Transcript_47195/m.84985 type:complete len:316 (+) Transcript_47195:528-1475(+)